MGALAHRAAIVAVLLLLALSALWAPAAHADTPIALYKSFAGNINFTGTQKSMRTASNTSNACSVVSGATNLTLALRGVPTGAQIINAQLYWAGSNATSDYTVKFDGADLSAPPARQYTSLGSASLNFYAGAADVTAQVTAKRNGDYIVSGLTVDSSATYCNSQVVLGGYQLLVVYSLSTETFRVLNIYEGFQFTAGSEFILTLGNFLTPSPLGTATGRVGHITWEGDETLNNAEYLLFNGVALSDSLNPETNQFNSTSSINGDAASYGIDFDAYTVRDPVIRANQTSASTNYKSGQDLVFTSAEIIAAPNVPATDRSITMTLDGTLAPSKTVSYIISVGNNGPLPEPGPVVVTDILPSTLIYSGATGTDWTCSAAGQKVTCSYNKPAPLSTAAQPYLPPITLRVTVALSATGLVSNSATVSGPLFDYYDGNNTSTVSARIGVAPFTPTYVLTDAPCVHNIPFGNAGQTCKLLNLRNVNPLANTDLRMFITYVALGVPTTLENADTSVPMRFAMSCHDPSSAANPASTTPPPGKTYFSAFASNTTLPACAQAGAVPAQTSSSWSPAATVVFKGGTPSSIYPSTAGNHSSAFYVLRYADVGRVEFFVTDSSGRLGSTDAFVSRPAQLVLAAAGNKSGFPAGSYGDGVFKMAGDKFTVTATAMTGGNTPIVATNFGKESAPVRVLVTPGVATDATSFPFTEMTRGADANSAAFKQEFIKLFTLDGDATESGAREAGSREMGASNGGVASGVFAFDEVGIVRLGWSIIDGGGIKNDYLGTGAVPGNPINVGRFIPHHFDTVAKGPIDCAAALSCPADVKTMAYSKQPFGLTVTARSGSAKTEPLRNYNGGFAKQVTLSAWRAVGGAAAADANPPSSPSGSALSAVTVPATAFSANKGGGAAIDYGVGSATPVYSFPAANAFAGTAPRANNWVAPTTIYVRAAESSVAAVGDGVTSLRSNAVEGGVVIVSGRLNIGTAYGSARLQLPLAVRGEFYAIVNGVGTWVLNEKDSVSGLTTATDTVLSCNAGVITARYPCLSGRTAIKDVSGWKLAGGKGVLTLTPPGAGGVIDVTASNPAWLPSTLTRAVFGVYRAPFIYSRELY